MPISIKTRLGNCKLSIKAQLRNDKVQAAAEYCMEHLVWHVVPSTAELDKKDSAVNRETPYSEALVDVLRVASQKVLG